MAKHAANEDRHAPTMRSRKLCKRGPTAFEGLPGCSVGVDRLSSALGHFFESTSIAASTSCITMLGTTFTADSSVSFARTCSFFVDLPAELSLVTCSFTLCKLLRFAHIFLNSSTAAKLSENRWSVQMKATISDLFSEKAELAADVAGVAFSSNENKSFRAVATPVTCVFPHSLHLSQPTQSMMRDTLRKCSLNSTLS